MKDIIRRCMVGYTMKVVQAANKANIGLRGCVIDETKHTLVLETKNGLKRIFKSNTTLQFQYKTKTINLDGTLIVGRPYDRVNR